MRKQKLLPVVVVVVVVQRLNFFPGTLLVSPIGIL